MPLTMARSGENVVIQRIGGKDDSKRHLASLGFVVGGDVTIVSRMSGNLIVNVKDTRIAISDTLANRIYI